MLQGALGVGIGFFQYIEDRIYIFVFYHLFYLRLYFNTRQTVCRSEEKNVVFLCLACPAALRVV